MFRSVSAHPSMPYVATSDITQACVWDLRYATQNQGSSLKLEGSAPRGASFSPITGGRILTPSSDGTVRIYESVHVFIERTKPIKRVKVGKGDQKLQHLNIKQNAMWHPRNENLVLTVSQELCQIQETRINCTFFPSPPKTEKFSTLLIKRVA